MDVWYNANIASASDFQITCYLQYQLHKVFPSALTKAGRRAPETAHEITSSQAFYHIKNVPPRNTVLVMII